MLARFSTKQSRAGQMNAGEDSTGDGRKGQNRAENNGTEQNNAEEHITFYLLLLIHSRHPLDGSSNARVGL